MTTRGRPPLAEPRDHTIKFRVTTTELTAIETAATDADTKPALWARHIVITAATEPSPTIN